MIFLLRRLGREPARLGRQEPADRVDEWLTQVVLSASASRPCSRNWSRRRPAAGHAPQPRRRRRREPAESAEVHRAGNRQDQHRRALAHPLARPRGHSRTPPLLPDGGGERRRCPHAAPSPQPRRRRSPSSSRPASAQLRRQGEGRRRFLAQRSLKLGPRRPDRSSARDRPGQHRDARRHRREGRRPRQAAGPTSWTRRCRKA